MWILAGDVGGTKTELALFAPGSGPGAPTARREFRSADFSGLETIVGEFLGSAGERVAAACFGVAGPVLGGAARTTNLPWRIDREALARRLGIEPPAVTLLNDLEAVALAIPTLDAADLLTLAAGEPDPQGAIAVIAPGTGLGEAYLTRDDHGYRAHPSEGGHADFAPADARQAGLLEYLREQHAHVSWETVCSGSGLPNVYAYLRDRVGLRDAPAVAGRIAAATDPTRAIIDAALEPEADSPLCRETLATFLAVLGAEAGNLALKVLATGGVFVSGGVARRVLAAVEPAPLLTAFRNKGRMSELMARMPIHVLRKRAALTGAAIRGLALLTSPAAATEAGGAAEPGRSSTARRRGPGRPR